MSNTFGATPVNSQVSTSATTTILNAGIVSWKFKRLGSWSYVMITSPSDKLLIIDGSQIVEGTYDEKVTIDIRAKIWDDKRMALTTMQIDGGQALPLTRTGDIQM